MDPDARDGLGSRRRSYGVVGATDPASAQWTPPAGWRAYQRDVSLGEGTALWDAVALAVPRWAVKTRSGFAIVPTRPASEGVRLGERYWLRARVLGVGIREPVEIVADVHSADRVGFAYGTLDGHPVSGEEAFIVHRDAAGAVWFTMRSLTRPGRGVWRVAFPLVVIAQRIYRRRYLRALLPR